MNARYESEAKNLRAYLTRVVPATLDAIAKDEEPQDGFSLHFAFKNGKLNVTRVYGAADTSTMTCTMADEGGDDLFADVAEVLDGDHPEWFEIG